MVPDQVPVLHAVDLRLLRTLGRLRNRGSRVRRGEQPGQQTYRPDTGTATYHSDKANGTTAGADTVDAPEFVARVVSHIPDNGRLQR